MPNSREWLAYAVEQNRVRFPFSVNEHRQADAPAVILHGKTERGSFLSAGDSREKEAPN